MWHKLSFFPEIFVYPDIFYFYFRYFVYSEFSTRAEFVGPIRTLYKNINFFGLFRCFLLVGYASVLIEGPRSDFPPDWS